MRLQYAILGGALAFSGIAVAFASWAADPHRAPIREFAETTVKEWVGNPIIVRSLKAQNERNAGLSQADIDRLDQQWRTETRASDHPLIDQVLGNGLSQFLLDVRNQQHGIVTEIFIMDDRGLNVGQSNVTSDYWQGDEAKWQETYLVGPGAVSISDVEFDESTQFYQSQVSMSIVDPESGLVIGAITVGIDVELLF